MKKIVLPIESSKEDSINPLQPDISWLTKMVTIVIGVLLLAIGGSYVFSHVLLSRIDLDTEKRYFGSMMIDESMTPLDLTTLQTLGVAESFSGYSVYIQDSPEENAYATLGGNIIVTSTLLENIEHEEELVFILGHERAHIEHRDVIRSFAQSMPIILTLQSLGIDTGNSMTQMSSVLRNYASREKESSADDAGIALLKELKLDPSCATGFFERNQFGFEKYIELFSNHPITQERLRKLENNQLNAEKLCTLFE